METEKTVKVETMVSPTKYSILILSYFFAGASIIVYLISRATSESFVIKVLIGLVLFFLFPFLFEKKIRRPFVREVQVVFKRFSLTIFPSDTNNALLGSVVSFNDIRFFRTIPAVRSDFSTLKLFLRDGTKIKYVFLEQENISQSETDINYIFREFVLEYNESVEPQQRIKIAPSFWATNAAQYTQWTIGIAMVTMMTFFAIKTPKTLFVSFVLPLLYYGITLIRREAVKDKESFS